MTYRCPRLITTEQTGSILGNGHNSFTAASTRKAMVRAGISEVRGYPDDEISADAHGQPGKGRWGHK